MPDGRIVNSPWYERHIYVYRIDGKRRVHISKGGQTTVIGSGATLRKDIEENVHRAMNFGRGTPFLHKFRPYLASNLISELYGNDHDKTVGGPFEYYSFVPPNQLTVHYVWCSSNKVSDVDVVHKGNQRTEITNKLTNEKCTLLPIWEWPPK